ncbi:hypothetical protein [Dietzia kunjamensis]|uniref:hypothetical protein n=1 Tax=Dietzia kunjamensis TaxID=322509 RepID=UPI00336775A4
MTAADRLAEIQTRVDKATDGPWRSRDLDDYDEETPDAVDVLGPGPSTIGMASARDWDSDYDPEMFANAEFIAHARTDVPALVAALRTVLDRHPMGEASVIEYAAAGEVKHCLGCRGAHGIAHDEYGLVPWPCPTVRAVEDALGEVAS